jgi:hypothetical protein
MMEKPWSLDFETNLKRKALGNFGLKLKRKALGDFEKLKIDFETKTLLALFQCRRRNGSLARKAIAGRCATDFSGSS